MSNGSAPNYIFSNPEAEVFQIVRPCNYDLNPMNILANLSSGWPYDVAAGMSHLAAQQPPIVHRDLKGVSRIILVP